MVTSTPYVKRTTLSEDAFCRMLWHFCYGVDARMAPEETAALDAQQQLYLNLYGLVRFHRRNASICARSLGMNRSTVTRYFTRFRKRMAAHVAVIHADHELVVRFHDPNTRHQVLADLDMLLHTPTIGRARTYGLHLMELIFRRVHLSVNIYAHLLDSFRKRPL